MWLVVVQTPASFLVEARLLSEHVNSWFLGLFLLGTLGACVAVAALSSIRIPTVARWALAAGAIIATPWAMLLYFGSVVWFHLLVACLAIWRNNGQASVLAVVLLGAAIVFTATLPIPSTAEPIPYVLGFPYVVVVLGIGMISVALQLLGRARGREQ